MKKTSSVSLATSSLSLADCRSQKKLKNILNTIFGNAEVQTLRAFAEHADLSGRKFTKPERFQRALFPIMFGAKASGQNGTDFFTLRESRAKVRTVRVARPEGTLISGPARGKKTIDETGLNLMISGPSEPFRRSGPFWARSADRSMFFARQKPPPKRCNRLSPRKKGPSVSGSRAKVRTVRNARHDCASISGFAPGKTTIDETSLNLMISGPSEPFGRSGPFWVRLVDRSGFSQGENSYRKGVTVGA